MSALSRLRGAIRRWRSSWLSYWDQRAEADICRALHSARGDDAAQAFLRLTNEQKADLIRQVPELYYAVARYARLGIRP